MISTSPSCNSGTEETALEKTFQNKIQLLEMENFKIPDTINTSLLIACYQETDPAGYTILVYHNENRKTVAKIKYQADGSVVTDSLLPVRFNEFRSAHYNLEYIVTKRSVTSVYKEKSCTNFASLSGTTEYARTDTNIAAVKNPVDELMKAK